MDSESFLAVLPADGARGEGNGWKTRIRDLERDRQDLELQLQTAVEHGDCLEDHLLAANAALRREIAERERAEGHLQALVAALVQQNSDLDVILQTLVDHGDDTDAEWFKRFLAVEANAKADGLTGIANRRSFDLAYQREWNRCRRSGQPLALIMADVDFFKQFNDHYGHLAGDDCLTAIAHLFEQVCRRPGDLAARFGGEEFILVLPATDSAGARLVARTLQERLRDKALRHETSPFGRVTLSIGIATTLPAIGDEPRHLLEEVDRQLYTAKRGGRNRVGDATL